MSKKDILDNFFNTNQNIKTPISESSKPKTKYTKKKIYDDPNKASVLENIIEVDTNDIYITPNKVDRLDLDLSKLEVLATNIATIGQLQPCTVRHNPKDGKSYELIFGERRYRAAKIKNISLKVVVKEVDIHTSALQLLSENINREDNSDYSLYQQISKFIKSGILKQSDIVKNTGMSKQKVSKLMCFETIPIELKDNIGNLSKISATTAECLTNISKNPSNTQLLFKVIDKIESGEYGHTKIKRFIANQTLISDKEKLSNKKQYSATGRHLFTVRRQDINNHPSIHFPKDILNLISSGKLCEDAIVSSLKKHIEDNLNILLK